MEVVIEMSLASTQDMELDKELKKRSINTKTTTSMSSTEDKESLEQKQTQNDDMSDKPPARALFNKPTMTMDTEMKDQAHEEDTSMH